MSRKQPLRTGGCVVLVFVLVACNPGERGEIAARVNGAPIRSEEIDFALEYKGVVGHDHDARQHQLERIVIEELLAQQFLRATPGSAATEDSAVSSARREILARRYVADLVARLPRPASGEIAAYYRANPDMFARRRMFVLRELEITAPAAKEGELRQRVRAARSLDDVADWLRREDLRFVATEAERGTDELPAEVVARLAKLKDGDVALQTTANGLRLLQVVRSGVSPLDEKTAWPQIERRLWMERQAAAVEAEVRRLSRMAAISIREGAGRDLTGPLTPRPDAVVPAPGPTVTTPAIRLPGS
jgi:EpsD family peptidyl-prolyl cis-trans isomerase